MLANKVVNSHIAEEKKETPQPPLKNISVQLRNMETYEIKLYPNFVY